MTFKKPGLYIVSTPIGNKGDITIRALETLKISDIIFCEDTRVSSKILKTYNINNKLKIYNEYSNEYNRYAIAKYIEQGYMLSLICNAGTPLICDPGYKLIKHLKDKYYIETIPGVCAAITALTISGLPPNQFVFIGFLPKKDNKKLTLLKQFLNIKATIICYETAKRIQKSLALALSIFGNVKANIGRELTKVYQESISDTLSNLISHFNKVKIKGEIVLSIFNNKKD